MKNEWIYGFATSLKERISLLKIYYDNLDTTTSLQAWRKRKTLLTNSQFTSMLKERKITEHEFGLGVMPLEEEQLKILFKYVKTQNWYIRHKNFFNIPASFNQNSLETALRFHIEYMNRQINDYLQNYPDIQLSTNALKSIKRALTDDLLAIAQRTLVWDVHDVLKRALISSPNKKEELTQYLKYRFATSEKTELFFLEYPTLSRLLSDRVYYFIQNLCYFFDSLLNSSKELADTFLIQKPYFISNLQFTNGDSHNLGQRPLTVDVNQNKLVFKFHSGQNLIILIKFYI